MMVDRVKRHPLFVALLFGALLLLVGIACGVSGTGYSTPRLADEAYAVCATATPVPTIMFTYPIGTSTPIPSSTPPIGMGTPISGVGFTTPVPTETPYYRVEYFYGDQIVHLDGMTLELTGWSQSPDPDHDDLTVYGFTFRIGNHIGDGQIFPLSQFIFIRQIVAEDGEILIGRWTAHPEHLGNLETQPMGNGETREYEIPIRAPKGSLTEVGLVSHWQSSLPGGVPIWFITDNDPVGCGYWWVDWQMGPPPRPTPSIIGAGGGGYGGVGVCGWPTSGTLSRGFGCSAFPTGIADPIGCPADRPHFHNGLDISAPTGTMIVAPVSGVIATGYDDARGFYVQVTNAALDERHDLLHMDAVIAVDGQQVPAGQAVGTVGNTGNSTGAHLHWTIRRGGAVIDPLSWNGCTLSEAGGNDAQ